MKSQVQASHSRVLRQGNLQPTTTFLAVLWVLLHLALMNEARAQRRIHFSNHVPNVVDAPVFETNGVTRLAGPAYLAQLYYSPWLNKDLPPSSAPKKFGNPVGFESGAEAGYFGVSNPIYLEIPELKPGISLYVEIRVWEAAAGGTFEAAMAAQGRVGVSDQVLVVGGTSQDPPFELSGLRSMKLVANGYQQAAMISPPFENALEVGLPVTLFLAYRGIPGPITVQWYRDSLAIPGATQVVYQINNLRREDAGLYQARISNSGVTVDTPLARLRVVDPPKITSVTVTPSQPVRGQPFQVEITATNPDPLTYEWYVNDALIPGATGPILRVDSAEIGSYAVLVRGGLGTTTRGVVDVRGEVFLRGSFGLDGVIRSPEGTIAAIPYQNLGYALGSALQLTASPAPNYQFESWYGDLTGTDNPKSVVLDRDTTVAAIFRPRAGTVLLANFSEGRLNAPVPNESGQPMGPDWYGQFYAGSSPDLLRPVGALVSFVNGYVTPEQTQILDGIPLGSPAVIQLRYWKKVAGSNWEQAEAANGRRGMSAALTINTGGAGLPPAPAAILAGFGGYLLARPPVFLFHPHEIRQKPGGSGAFEVAISGLGPISYQWFKNGQPIPGATQQNLQFASITDADAGDYRVRVQTPYGTAESGIAPLVVLYPPILRGVQRDHEPIPRKPIQLTPTVESRIPVEYLWTHNGHPIPPGPLFPVLSLDDAQPGTYRLVVTSEGGTASLDVLTIPDLYLLKPVVQGEGEIGFQPVLETYPPGTEVQLEAIPRPGHSFVGWTGDATGTEKNLRIVMNGDHRIVATFAPLGGSILFANRIGTDLDAPVFHTNGTTRLEGDAFAAQLYGGATLETLIPLGTPASFRPGAGAGYIFGATVFVPKVPPGDWAWIQMRAWDRTGGSTFEEASRNQALCGASLPIRLKTGGQGSPPSLPASPLGLSSFRLEVPRPLELVSAPKPSIISIGDALRLEVVALGLGPITYQWFRDDVEIPGATNATYEIPQARPGDAGRYQVRVVSPLTTTGSPAVDVVTTRLPQSLSFDLVPTARFGDAPIELNALASSGLPVTFQVDPSLAAIEGSQLRLLGAGEVHVTATQPGNDTYLPADPVSRWIRIEKAAASLVIELLEWVADGTPKHPSARTTPPGLQVLWRFDGQTTPPTQPGEYIVQASISDPNYEGAATATLRIAAATFELAGVVFEDHDRDGQRDASDAGLEGFTVRVQNPGGDRLAVTDSDGRFRLAGLTAGTHAFQVIPESGLVPTSPIPTQISASASESLFLNLAFHRNDPTAAEAFGSWTRSHSLPVEQSGPGADLDGDGYPNLVEFVAGTNPTLAEDHPNLRGSVAAIDGQTRAGIEFRRHPDAAKVRILLERSQDLSGWIPIASPVLSPGPSGNEGPQTWFDSQPMLPTEIRFLRVRFALD
ncbi:MAG: hypothetical protein JNK85_23155 [Verrucomicrobiales bacterium]|nr:hypothetical protein [Verrucomicrobiales bacterium]